MNRLVFKRLFEVQVLHDYFLTTSNGVSFFERNLDDKKILITNSITNGTYTVNELFSIQPLEDTKERMKEYNLMTSFTPLGFFVGIKVEVENQGGEEVYKPSLEIPQGINLSFSINPKISFFRAVTALRFGQEFKSIHYFTNKKKQELTEEVVPAYTSLPLTNSFKPHQLGKVYEMDELVDFSGTLKQALQRTDGADSAHWVEVKNRGFSSDADRNLLPQDFSFSLKKEDLITQIEFVLEDEAGNVVKTIHKSAPIALGNVALNFSKEDETDPNSAEITAGNYTLKVIANAGNEFSYKIYLNSAIYDKNALGIIDIRFDEINSPYSLLDANGYLKSKITATNEKVPHPVFELRFKNRSTYWRYKKEHAFSASDITDTSAHLATASADNKTLVSIKPKALTQALVPFINGVSQTLPHPKNSSLRVEKEKIFSEIFINPSNRLLNG